MVFDDLKVNVQQERVGAHHLLKKVANKFQLPKSTDWKIHMNHPLLTVGFENLIIDSSSLSPYALYRAEILLITCTLYEPTGKIHSDLRRLCQNHIRFLAESLVSRDKSKFSLTNILFGKTAFRSALGCKKSILLLAETTVKIPTALLPHGPRRLKLENSSSKALGSLFKKKLVKDSEKYSVIYTETNLLPKVVQSRFKFQDPREHRAKRFVEFLEKQNYEVPILGLSFSITPLEQSDASEAALTRSVGHEEVYQKSTHTESKDPPLESLHSPESASSGDNLVPRTRSNRPTTALSKHSDAIMTNKRRPVSATVLAMRLPLHHPSSDSCHESTVILSPTV